MEKPIVIEVGLPARDHLTLNFETQDGVITRARLHGVGCWQLLKLLEAWRPRLQGPVSALEAPEGGDHASMLMRELILKAQGRWKFPYIEEELCHCRAVPTAKVDAAVVAGCHTLQEIRDSTSASTSCGACRPDVESVIAYRLGK